MKLLLTTIESECESAGLELKYLYSVIADSPMEVRLKSYESGAAVFDIYEDIASGQYNIVYFHCSPYNEYRLLRVAEMVKKASPGTAVVFGGMQVSFETRRFMKANPFVDYVIRGEGERVLFSFIRTLLDYEFDFEGTAGLAYRDNDQVVVNPYDAPLDMELLPFPYERFEADRDIVYYESVRGSSDRSIYSQHMPDARVRALSLGRVCTELRYFLKIEVGRVVFLDRWFNFNSERAYRIFQYIIHNDNGITAFEFNINGDELDEETIRLLSEARKGQIILNIYVASTNSEVLASIGRNENIYRLMYNTAKLIQSGNVQADIHITAGLPLETLSLFARSFNKAFGMAEGMPVHIDSLCISKGTLIREDAERLGYVYSSEPPYEVIATGHMSSDELLKLRRIAKVVEGYIGDGGFRRSLPRMLNDTGLKPFDLFSGLTSFIYRSGLSGKLRKKEQLARILYAYAGGLYDELSNGVRLDILKDHIHEDLESRLSEEAIRKFDRKGWKLDVRHPGEDEKSPEDDAESLE